MNLHHQLDLARTASHETALLSTEQKNKVLQTLAAMLRNETDQIIEENTKDMERGKKNNLGSMLDRLMLSNKRIDAIASDTENVAALHDFVGETIHEKNHENGMRIKKIRTSIGVIGMIYEARPNVTVDAAVLALKSGNTIVLKGGEDAAHSNRVLVKIMREALKSHDITPEAIQLLDGATRADAVELMKANGKIDILIPRGSNRLIAAVKENATVPVIETGASPVHTIVDESADLDMAVSICVNEKVRRTSVCNALDTILVHEKISDHFLKKLILALQESAEKKGHPSVAVHADQKSFEAFSTAGYESLHKHSEGDYDIEWLNYAMNIRVVKNFNEALQHVQKYSLGHSESVVTKNDDNAQRFLNEIDAACVYHNVSTCFTDGAEFGLGAEIGISTQKLHARGPFALEALTTVKWVVTGEGQTRE